MTIYTKTTDFQAKDALASGNPLKIVKGTEIDNEFDAIAAADATNLKKDGTVTATANIPMGTYKFTGLGSGSAKTDSSNLGQVQDGVVSHLGSVSGVDTITATASPSLSAYTAGNKFSFVSAGANTGAVTINIDSLGAKSITKLGTTALAAGDIPSGSIVYIVYDGTRFQMVGVANVNVSAATGTLAIANGGTGQTTAANAFDALKQSATDTYTGVVELTTTAEVQTGTDTTRAVTASALQNGKIVKMTAQATTSGTSITFSSIPSWVKKIVVGFNAVSTDSASPVVVRLGAGSTTSSGYVANAVGLAGSGVGHDYVTDGFRITNTSVSAATNQIHGQMIITNIDGNVWVSSHNLSLGNSAANMGIGSGLISLGGTLDRVVLTTVSGTANFDGGSVNVVYE